MANIDDELQDFWDDEENSNKNIRLFFDFVESMSKINSIDLDSTTFNIGEPKFKKKLKGSTWIPPSKRNNGLF